MLRTNKSKVFCFFFSKKKAFLRLRPALLAIADTLNQVLAWLEIPFLWAASLCLAVSLAINIVNLAARNILGFGMAPVFSWTMVLFVWMVFLAFFPLYRRRMDITVDMIVSRLPPLPQLALRLGADALAVVVLGAIVAQLPRIIDSQVGRLDFVGLERYMLSLPLVASCALVALLFVVDALEALGGRKPPFRTL